jgi:alanine racemase
LGFGVATVEEGIELRRDGVRSPIFVMSGIQFFDKEMIRCLETCRLTPVISSLPVLKQLVAHLGELSSPMGVHLKFNTGMNRLGIEQDEWPQVLALLNSSPAIQVEGLMSHLAKGENAKAPITRKQVSLFRAVVAYFARNGLRPRWIHLHNSAGMAAKIFPEGNLHRVGLHLYGLGHPKLRPIARWTAPVFQTRRLKKGEGIGYGPYFKAKRSMKMAVLGVGYGDGYRRSFSNVACVLVRGVRCPIVGTVSMDLTAVDVSRVPVGVNPGDQAVLLGKDGKQEITAEELGRFARTIPYEILTGISPRVPRFFL